MYTTVEEVIEANRRVLQRIHVHKADRHGILMGDVGKEKIGKAIAAAETTEDDVYAKAAALLISLVKGHPFESGNRRTAYAAAVDFLESNGFQAANTYDVEVIRGIRSGTHKRTDVALWLKGHGKQGQERNH